jgi:hypothetical protein
MERRGLDSGARSSQPFDLYLVRGKEVIGKNESFPGAL